MKATTLGLSATLFLLSARKTEKLLEQANVNDASQQVKQAIHCYLNVLGKTYENHTEILGCFEEYAYA
jgi:hypothetical protein